MESQYIMLVCSKCGATDWESEIIPRGNGTNDVRMVCKQCGHVEYDSRELTRIFLQKRG